MPFLNKKATTRNKSFDHKKAATKIEKGQKKASNIRHKQTKLTIFASGEYI